MGRCRRHGRSKPHGQLLGHIELRQGYEQCICGTHVALHQAPAGSAVLEVLEHERALIPGKYVERSLCGEVTHR